SRAGAISHRKRAEASCYTLPALHVPARRDSREIPDPRQPRLRRFRHGLSRPRHLDRQEGRDQGPAPPDGRLRRAAPGAAAARGARSPENRLAPPGQRHPAPDPPNIVSILTAERTNGTFFIVMEYVKGETLEAVLDREKSLDVPRALSYAVQIRKGVEHAHEAQILHRDLRPANVLISESGALKVADFGTSRLLERSHATTVIGSPPYMAPEAFQGRAVLASDIYSV